MKSITEETIKSLWQKLSLNGLLYLPIGKKDLQFKSHNIEFKLRLEDLKDALIQGILTRAITKEPGKWVSAIAPKYIDQSIIDDFQNGKNPKVEFEEITTDFPYELFDSILTIGITAPSIRDKKFELAKNLLNGKLVIKNGLPSISEIKEADLAFNLWQKNNYNKENIIRGFIINKEEQICRNNLWAYYSPSLKLKYGIYYTPEKFALKSELMVKKYTKNDDIIWEPCAGDGRLVKNFKNKIVSDILAVPGTLKHDFIKDKDNTFQYDFIYTNPGFKIAQEAFEKALIIGKPFGMYIPDYALPARALPIVEGFYTYSKEWPNLPVNNSSKNGFGIVFIIVDPRKPAKKSIILKDSNDKDILLELEPPQDSDLFSFKQSKKEINEFKFGNKPGSLIKETYHRYHPQEYAYNSFFKGKYVDGILGQFVRKSWIKNISYTDGQYHWWTSPNGLSKQIIVYSEEQLDTLLNEGWVKGRKQKISNIRKVKR